MQQSYGPPQPPQPGPSQWYPSYTPPPPAPRAGGGRGLAITALVMSGIALLAILGFGVLVVIAALHDYSRTGGLTGQLTASTHGGRVTGDTLAADVSDWITRDGGDVSRMDCPETPRVGQGIVTVCHGVINGSRRAVIVYFEDEDGRFTLEPL